MTPEAGGPGALFLVLDFAGLRAAFPGNRVVLVSDWSPPIPLPRGAMWLAGWHPHEGRATPVISPRCLRDRPWVPRLSVLLEADDQMYFLPGESARFVRGTSSSPPPGAAFHTLGSLRCRDADEVPVFDASLLYRAFHLGYNHALDG